MPTDDASTGLQGTTSPQPIRLIVAYDRNRLIGDSTKSGTGIPWDIPADRHHFAKLTKRSTVIMGRNTYNGLIAANPGREPLPHRIKYVVSPCSDLKYARATGQLYLAAMNARQHDQPVWIIGGGATYQDALAANLVDEIIASEIDAEYTGDVYFPPLGPEWREVERDATHRGDGFDVVRYRKLLTIH